MDTKDLTVTPTWQDVPWELNERKVVYRNGDARLIVSKVWDDFPIWAEDEGQIPFYSPEGSRHSALMANEQHFPDESNIRHAYYELGSWELVCRWLRIFHDAEIAEYQTITTGYSQGDFRGVLTIVTKEWRERVGVDLDRLRLEIDSNSHLKEFAAWCAGDYLMAEIEVADPKPGSYEFAMEHEADEPGGMYWNKVDEWIDAMDGPLHTSEDVNEWLADACMCTDSEAELAVERRSEVVANGHWVI